MCIKKVSSFEFAGKLYSTELEAVKAALTEIGTRIIKDHSSNPLEGLLKHGADISALRGRYFDLTAPDAKDSEATPEKQPTTLSARRIEDGMATLDGDGA